MIREHEFIIGIIISIIAFLLNITEVVFLLRQKHRRSNYQNLIFSLSLADIFTAVFFLISFTYRHEFAHASIHAVAVITEETLWFSVTSSLVHVFSISIDRLLAIRFPIKHRCWYTGSKNRVVIALIWIMSFLFILPAFFISFFTTGVWIHNTIVSCVVLAVGVMLAALYAYIIRQTVSKQCMIEIITLKSGKREVISACSPREKRILFMSVSIVTSFIICSFPFAINYIVNQRMNETVLLLIVNSILNPVIYFFQGRYQEKRSETIKQRAEKTTKTWPNLTEMKELAVVKRD